MRPAICSGDPEITLGGAKASKLRALRARRPRLDTVGALVAFTAGVIGDVLEGRIGVDVGRTAIYGLSLQRQLLETAALAQIEGRLNALEAMASNRTEVTPWA